MQIRPRCSNKQRWSAARHAHPAARKMIMLLEGKVALVTGAGRGFGAGIARALAHEDARVCITDIDMPELASTAAEVERDGGEALVLRLDVSDLPAFEATVRQVVERWGRLDVLVHSAIFMPLIRFEHMSPDIWWRQIDVGLGGLYNGARVCWDVMKAQGGGHIIGI